MQRACLILVVVLIVQLLHLSESFTAHQLVRQKWRIQALAARLKTEDIVFVDDEMYLSFTMKYLSSKLASHARSGKSIPMEELQQLKNTVDAVVSAVSNSPPVRATAGVSSAPVAQARTAPSLPVLKVKPRQPPVREKSPTAAQSFSAEISSAELAAAPSQTRSVPVPAPTPAPTARAPAPVSGSSSSRDAVGSYQKRLQEMRSRQEAVAKGVPVPPRPRAVPRVGTVTVSSLVSTDPSVFPDEQFDPDSPLAHLYGMGSSWDIPGQENMTTEEFYRAINARNKAVRDALQKKYGTKEPAKEYFETLNKMRQGSS